MCLSGLTLVGNAAFPQLTMRTTFCCWVDSLPSSHPFVSSSHFFFVFDMEFSNRRFREICRQFSSSLEKCPPFALPHPSAAATRSQQDSVKQYGEARRGIGNGGVVREEQGEGGEEGGKEEAIACLFLCLFLWMWTRRLYLGSSKKIQQFLWSEEKKNCGMISVECPSRGVREVEKPFAFLSARLCQVSWVSACAKKKKRGFDFWVARSSRPSSRKKVLFSKTWLPIFSFFFLRHFPPEHRIAFTQGDSHRIDSPCQGKKRARVVDALIGDQRRMGGTWVPGCRAENVLEKVKICNADFAAGNQSCTVSLKIWENEAFYCPGSKQPEFAVFIVCDFGGSFFFLFDFWKIKIEIFFFPPNVLHGFLHFWWNLLLNTSGQAVGVLSRLFRSRRQSTRRRRKEEKNWWQLGFNCAT